MSIFPLFLLMGVSIARHISYYTDTSPLQPIVTRSQERQICAELCMSGLGGAGCGDDCVDITPQSFPLQSLNENTTVSFGVATRYNSCNVLCENNLGAPLCLCDSNTTKSSRPNFVAICSFFCTTYDYRIYGCQACNLYSNAVAGRMLGGTASALSNQPTPVVDWDMWCQKMCQDGDGGAACNCDLLPMSLNV